MIDVCCFFCEKLLCKVSKDFFGVVQLKCRHCKKINAVSVATILKQIEKDPAIIKFPTRAPAR
jgi:phage FluMu protein Com